MNKEIELWESNEGAIYLFAGWLTSRDKNISCGATEDASPMAEAIKEYKEAYPDRFTSPEPKRKPMTEYEEDEAFNSASKWAAWLETENRMLREARKPLSPEKRIEGYIEYENCMGEGHLLSFVSGIVFAEEQHNIGHK